MPKFTYPIIFILNPETEFFNGYIPDLAIFAEGKSPEDVYAEMEEILKNYMVLAAKYNTEIPDASTLDEVTKKWPGYKVSLISAAT
jgi:predicted RNase H-like HicB family nuclease